MICSLCHKNDAVIFVEQTNVAAPRKKMNVCLVCASKFGISPDTRTVGNNLSALFDAFVRHTSASNNEKKSPDKSKLCPVCGISLFQIKNNRKAGCSECYSIFKNEIDVILQNLGADSRYKGSMPKRIRNFNSVLTTRIAIQEKLEESLKEENYEKAAVYRDYLRALEKTPVSGDSDE